VDERGISQNLTDPYKVYSKEELKKCVQSEAYSEEKKNRINILFIYINQKI
jgi:hypothetical protein